MTFDRNKKRTASLALTALLLVFQLACAAKILPDGRPNSAGAVILICARLVFCLLVLLLNTDLLADARAELKGGRFAPALPVAAGWAVCFAYSLYSVAVGRFETALLACGALLVEGWALCRPLLRTPQTTAEARVAGLKGLIPTQTTRREKGMDTPIDTDQLEVDDLFVTGTGQRFAFDGRVMEGSGAADEALLTGQTGPVEKQPGSRVLAGTENLNTPLTAAVEALGPYTRLGRAALRYKRFAAEDTPVDQKPLLIQLAAALLAAVLWLVLGKGPAAALGSGVCLLFAVLPVALPRLPMAANLHTAGDGLAKGISFGSVAALDKTAALKNVVLLKSTTVTNLAPRVTEVYAKGLPERFLLGIAASLCLKSHLPLADSIMEYVGAQGISVRPALDFEETEGRGMTGKISTKISAAGDLDFIRSVAEVPEDVRESGFKMEQNGCDVIYFALGGSACGVVGCVPIINQGFAPAVARLKELGLHTVLLTPDEPRVAGNLGRQAGLDEVVSELQPADFAREAARLQTEGPTALIGSFSADAEALAAVDVKVALGMEKEADLALMSSHPVDLAEAVRLARTLPPRRELLAQKARLCSTILWVMAAVLPPLAPAVGLPVVLAAIIAGHYLAVRLLMQTAQEPDEVNP